MDFLAATGRLGAVDVRAGSLHLLGTDPTIVAAKRVSGIGDPMLLERRASALADAADVALEALDLALYNWTSAERATLVATPAAGRPGRSRRDRRGARRD